MHFEPVLAADVIEILTRGIPVILFILWLVGQAISERQKQAKMAQRQERQAPAQPKPNPQRPPAEIEDEIDAFLRRASEKKKGQPQPQRKRDETVILVPPNQDRKTQTPVAPQEAQSRTPRDAAASEGDRAKRAMERPVRGGQRPLPPTPKPMVLQSGRPLHAGGLGSLRSSLTPSTSPSSSDLTDDISLADDRMAAHLHSVFDHQVGRLQHRETTPTRPVSGSPIADSVVKMLKDPQGVQQLIVAQEILRRPEL